MSLCALCIVACFPLAVAFYFKFNKENECSRPRQDSKSQTEAVITVKKKEDHGDVRPQYVCPSQCYSLLCVCLAMHADAAAVLYGAS